MDGSPSAGQPASSRDLAKGRFFLLRVDDFDDRFELVGTNVVVGRDADCQLRLDDGKVSSRHCTLMWHNDTFRIVDLDSRNGVRVNGRQVSAGKLASGDMVQIGPRRFFFWRQGDALPTFDPASVQEEERVDDERMDSDASDRRVAVDGTAPADASADPPAESTAAAATAVQDQNPAAPAAGPAAGSAPAAESAPAAPDEPDDGQQAASAPTAAVQVPPTEALPVAQPGEVGSGATTEQQAEPGLPRTPTGGLQFADDTDELRLQTRTAYTPLQSDQTPEALAALLHRPAATAPTTGTAAPAAATAAPAATTTPATPAAPTAATPVRTSGRQRKTARAGALARTLPIAALVGGLAFFAIGLGMWVVASASAKGVRDEVAETESDASEELDLLRLQLGAARGELRKLVERREALEAGLSDATRDDLVANLADLGTRVAAVAARLTEIDTRMAAVLDRVDQLESTVRRYERGEKPNPPDNGGD